MGKRSFIFYLLNEAGRKAGQNMTNKNRKFHTSAVDARFERHGSDQGRGNDLRNRDELAYASVLKILG